MNTMTWLDLYQFLHKQANSIKNLEDMKWNEPVVIHNAETGEEYHCDTYNITNDNDNNKLVLVINVESIYS